MIEGMTMMTTNVLVFSAESSEYVGPHTVQFVGLYHPETP
jgi:hypothetical protein